MSDHPFSVFHGRLYLILSKSDTFGALFYSEVNYGCLISTDHNHVPFSNTFSPLFFKIYFHFLSYFRMSIQSITMALDLVTSFATESKDPLRGPAKGFPMETTRYLPSTIRQQVNRGNSKQTATMTRVLLKPIVLLC